MRRIVLWGLSTISVVVLLFGYSTSTSGPAATGASTAFVSSSSAGTTTSAPPADTSTDGSTDGSTGSSTGSSTDTPSASATPSSGSAAATTVTGDVADTRWGPVQVQLTVSGSSITKVTVLQYPSGDPRDEEINSRALPILIQETMDAQSADIDMVSGATYTSDGYVQSLQSALDQAGA